MDAEKSYQIVVQMQEMENLSEIFHFDYQGQSQEETDFAEDDGGHLKEGYVEVESGEVKKDVDLRKEGAKEEEVYEMEQENDEKEEEAEDE